MTSKTKTTMCRIVKWAFAVAYIAALSLFAIGTWGWLGADLDQLSGGFLTLLGLPWNLFVDSFGDVSPAVLAALAPALNLAILSSLCSALRRRQINSRNFEPHEPTRAK